MEPYRKRHRLTALAGHRQAGISVIAFLVLATLIGIVGLGAMKVVPMYLSNMRLSTLLEDLETELSGEGVPPGRIQGEMDKRFSVEDVRVAPENVKITQSPNGYYVRVQFERRAPYVGDIWFLIPFDKQIEIRR